MEEKDKKSVIAVFRYGVIADFVGARRLARGDKEKALKEKSACMWDIPFSGRSRISRSTILHWIRKYQKSGGRIESLYPDEREDKGTVRAVDPETVSALLRLRAEHPEAPLPSLLAQARKQNILPPDFRASDATLYRIFQKAGPVGGVPKAPDRRRFEAERANDIWQSDALHGPRVLDGGRLRKSYLFAFIDDHSRLVPHAEFYLSEGLVPYMDCLRQAIAKRGVSGKLYVDNGPAFRSHHLGHVTASLGTALVHARPYQPEGKGKIERFFKTVRMQVLSLLVDGLSLPELNKRLWEWIDKDYHQRVHASTKQTPLSRYLAHLKTIREAPKDLDDYFRRRAVRRVDKDRTVSLDGRVYEAPVELVEKQVTLLYHSHDPSRVEAFWNNRSYGMLAPVNLVVNCRVKRSHNHTTEIEPGPPRSDGAQPGPHASYGGGRLFEQGENDHGAL